MERRYKLISIVLGVAIVLMNTISVMAWTSDTSVSTSSGVAVSTNSSGQTVFQVYKGGYLQLEIFARNGNIWNNTSQVLLTDSNKGVTYVGIDTNLNVYGINSNNIAVRYSKYFASGSTPELLSEHPGAASFETNSTGFVTGIHTNDGLYSISQDRIVNATTYGNTNSSYNYYNTSYPSGYPYVVQSGTSYYYYTSSSNKYTYTFSSNKLKYGSKTIASNVDEVAWGYGKVLYVTTSNQVYESKIGSTTTSKVCSNFSSWVYDSNNLVIAARDTNTRVYSISSSSYAYDGYYGYDYDDYDYDDYDYDDDYDDYPRVYSDGNYYYYKKSSRTIYLYLLTSAGKLYDEDNDQLIASNVEEIAFSEGYLLYVKEDVVYLVKLGSSSYTKKYSGFQEFIYGDDDLVEAIETWNNTYYL